MSARTRAGGGRNLNQPLIYRTGTKITRTYSHGQVLLLEVGGPCTVRIRSTVGSGNRYSVVIDASDVDDEAETGDTD